MQLFVEDVPIVQDWSNPREKSVVWKELNSSVIVLEYLFWTVNKCLLSNVLSYFGYFAILDNNITFFLRFFFDHLSHQSGL